MTSHIVLQGTYLIIPSFTEEDEGTYRCFASSVTGTTYSQVTLVAARKILSVTYISALYSSWDRSQDLPKTLLLVGGGDGWHGRRTPWRLFLLVGDFLIWNVGVPLFQNPGYATVIKYWRSHLRAASAGRYVYSLSNYVVVSRLLSLWRYYNGAKKSFSWLFGSVVFFAIDFVYVLSSVVTVPCLDKVCESLPSQVQGGSTVHLPQLRGEDLGHRQEVML